MGSICYYSSIAIGVAAADGLWRGILRMPFTQMLMLGMMLINQDYQLAFGLQWCLKMNLQMKTLKDFVSLKRTK
jgi:hypothetical protein